MKPISTTITLLLILLAIYISFTLSIPSYRSDLTTDASNFSTDRALKHVEHVSKQPHAVGFPAHVEVREYIVTELEKMGLHTSFQEGYAAGDWGNLSKAINILARIEGSNEGKALVLLSHYDSSPHSSLGASDAGSGVATILEGIRAFLAENKTPKNDIIILFTDAEELGLNGADLFVNKHPWAKEVGLVLNFEARGSGGPSYMLLETNRGNSKLIKEFIAAELQFPVTNSLAYSVYKMLPNDTDLTVFRKDRDIDGFNFAFIDDYYDHHTARDNYARLDRNTLAHQGSYLMPLLRYFSNSDLTDLKNPNDYVYFSVPFFKLVSYPFEWIYPMLILAILFFIVLLFYGLQNKLLNANNIVKGFLPLLLVLIINCGVGFYSWSFLKWIYPQYNDMLHGFTYNGYTYILAFVLFATSVCFWAYHRFRKIETANLLVAPLFLWLLICGLIASYLPGASFFIFPVFALLASLLIVMNLKVIKPYLLFFLTIPALFIYAPLIKIFPVGLGLKMIVATTLLTTLTFVLLLPVFGFYTKKKMLAFLIFVLFVGFMVSAHFSSGFTKDNAKPSSLLYVLNADTNTAQWATYDHTLIDWNKNYFGTNKKNLEQNAAVILSSKYSTGFSYIAEAPLKTILPPTIEKVRDTVIGNERLLEICILPQRNVNRLEIFTNDITIKKGSVNGIPLSDFYLENRKSKKLITHYISQNDFTELEFTVPMGAILELTLFEASNDLLENPLFSIPPRPENSIPMPFVLNDAILLTKTVRFD